jgi:hypothetical protein
MTSIQSVNLALPEGSRVLTPEGSLIVEPSLEYDRIGSNRLIFRGVDVVPGIQLGLLDANDVARDIVIGAIDLRYGLFDRFEIEARIPYVYRHDRLTVVSQQVTTTSPPATDTTALDGNSIGDIEFSMRYQLNRATEGGAVFVGGIRVKTATGTGPFDVDFDSSGVAKNLSTGSGFWAIEPTLAVLYPSDPVVIYFNLGYLYNFTDNVNRDIGTTHVGRVHPGDAIPISFGFGFALNPQFSFSLGISNTFVMETRTELGGLVTHANSIEAASLTMGMSYIFSPRLALSTNFEFGVTPDAPDLRAIFRLPYRF